MSNLRVFRGFPLMGHIHVCSFTDRLGFQFRFHQTLRHESFNIVCIALLSQPSHFNILSFTKADEKLKLIGLNLPET
jgi:hypothetical protein